MNFFLSMFLQVTGLLCAITIIAQILGKIFIKDIQEDFED